MATSYDSKPQKASKKADASSKSSQEGVQQFQVENHNPTHQKELEIAGMVQRQENRTGMPDSLKAGIESLSGYSMNDVKVHYNSAKPAQLNAHAYAQGNQIHLASGQEKHLAHEAWHVVQQKQGRVKPTAQVNGASINDNAGLEKEADVMGGKAAQLKSISSGSLISLSQGIDLNAPFQLRTIVGEIRTKKKSNGNGFEIDRRGASNPSNIAISNGGSVNVNAKAKRVLGGTDDFMRGHLMKGSWDDNNDLERMTQWDNSVEEAAWTDIEEAAQIKAIEDSESATDKKISSFTYTVTTEVDSPNHGDSILGAHNGAIPKKWLKDAIKLAAGNAIVVNNLRDELNRMVNKATMSIEGDSKVAKYKMAKEEVGSVDSNAHNGLKIYDN